MTRSSRTIALLVFLVALFAGVFALLLAWEEYRAFEGEPLVEEETVRLQVRNGDTLRSVARRLETLGMTRVDWRWDLLSRRHDARIKAGEYQLDRGTTPVGMLRRLVAGDVLRHRFTIVEGWTVDELRATLAGDARLRRVTTDWDADRLMERLGCTGCFDEGRFLPETYFFVRGDRDLDLLERAHDAMRAALAEAWSARDADLNVETPEELLVLASLVEKETAVAAERERIAGVFQRRLERGMRLQTDPTVAYGLRDELDGRLRRVHLRTDHPWNTYTRHGLPPTPIALPGRASLQAAARPADGTALYFVARGDGTHAFSDTLAEHNRAVDRFIRGRR